MGSKAAGSQRSGVDGADGSQCAVRAFLDVGLNIIEGRGSLAAGAGGEKEGGQREGYKGDAKITHRCKAWVQLKYRPFAQDESRMPGKAQALWNSQKTHSGLHRS